LQKAILRIAAFLTLSLGCLHAQQASASAEKDTSPHTMRLIEVEPGVKLEVLDWGGTGRPLILLAGQNFTAHDFDQFAPKLTAQHHVYGITRRGFGTSSVSPPTSDNYSAVRLGDDILAVIAALGLDRPVLVGHSIAGEELSSIGTRHPEKVAGLIYLDAGYSYAYYAPQIGDLLLDAIDVRKSLNTLLSGQARDMKQFVLDLQTLLPQLEKDLQEMQRQWALAPGEPQKMPPLPQPLPTRVAVNLAIRNGEQKFGGVNVPVLAIFAAPHRETDLEFADNRGVHDAMVANDRATTTAQAEAFKAGMPNARIVFLPNASHHVFKSNESDVLREINSFVASLP
jgi:pimeloyl-ACP methyl ester carboxylesterase